MSSLGIRHSVNTPKVHRDYSTVKFFFPTSNNMKIANQVPRKGNGVNKGNGGFIRAPISIERPKELFSFAEEGSHLEMKLRSSPTVRCSGWCAYAASPADASDATGALGA